jgi:hypothetical protein
MKTGDKEKAKIRAEIIMSLKEGYKPKVKQTAVEWFYQRILAKDIKSIFEQAKELEKQQIIKAIYDSMGTNLDPNMGRAEQYYNETFKNK